jgi:asparagine synthase (glutamine-hydrolysing)
MCGIAGAVGLTAEAVPDSDRVARMTDMLAHRGPDAAGHWCSDGRRVQFGHRRLSVIDLATGAQPMSDETGRFTLVFNGEIYNYRELRRQLVDDGVRLRTESDTEVLLQLLIRDWDQAVRHLIGMFAFAVWDSRRRRLLIARDRIGEKPLYFMQDQGSLYFASTFHALYATCRNKPVLDIAGLDDFLTLGYVPAPRTIASGISKLPAGALLLADDGGSVEVRRYWSIAQGRAEFEGTYEQAVDALEEKLQDAVRIRLRSDVPLGVFLSGGVDSSLVAALAARESAGRLQMFSIGFDEARFDETAAARSVADHVGAEHHVFRARFDIVDLLPQIVRHYGEPFGDPSALPVWMLAQETRRHVTVAIGGDGGDEGFGGYEWYWTAARLRRLRALIPERGDALWTRAMNRATRYSHRLAPFQRGLALIMASDAERFASLRSFVGPVEAATLYAGELAAHRMVQPTESQRRFADIFGDATGSHLHRMRVVDIETYLADCLMPKVDIATMAHGLEARAPLLDPDLLQFALSLPDRWIANGRGGKRILKDVLGRHLPIHLFERPKQGFTVPLETWFNRELKTRIAGLADSDVLNELDLLRSQGIAALVAEHAAGRRDHSQRLYNLLVLEEWLRQNS